VLKYLEGDDVGEPLGGLEAAEVPTDETACLIRSACRELAKGFRRDIEAIEVQAGIQEG